MKSQHNNKSAQSEERSFSPAQVRTAGAVAVGYLLAAWAVETWPLVGANPAGAGLSPLLAVYGVLGAIFAWLGVEIWISQRTWAALLVFGHTTLFTIWDFLSFLQGQQSKWWVLAGSTASYYAFQALKGARRLKAERRGLAVRQDEPPLSTGPGPGPGPTTAETAHSGLQVVLVGLLLVATASGLSACDKPKDAANRAATAVEGLAIPPDLASACIFSAAPAGYPSIFGASLTNLAQALTKPNAILSWEKSATGYILRQTVADQLSGTTMVNSISLRPVNESQTKSWLMGVTDNPFQCGPKGLYADRSIIAGREFDAAATWSLLTEVINTPPSKQTPPTQAAGISAAATSSAAIPASEFPKDLDAVYVPADKTVAGVVRMAQDVCHRTGTDDAPASFEVMNEWAAAKTELYDLAIARGYKMSPADETCYRDGKDQQREVAQDRADPDAPDSGSNAAQP